MAQQQEGWPLGLRLLNARIGLVRNRNDAEFSASASFTTLLTPSLSSASMDSSSSSHLDSQSTGSLFHHDKSNTLGSLIGISSIFEFSRRSTRGRMLEPFRDSKKNHKLKPWLFSLCSRLTTDAVTMKRNGNNVPLLVTTLKKRGGLHIQALREREHSLTLMGLATFRRLETRTRCFLGIKSPLLTVLQWREKKVEAGSQAEHCWDRAMDMEDWLFSLVCVDELN